MTGGWGGGDKSKFHLLKTQFQMATRMAQLHAAIRVRVPARPNSQLSTYYVKKYRLFPLRNNSARNIILLAQGGLFLYVN